MGMFTALDKTLQEIIKRNQANKEFIEKNTPKVNSIGEYVMTLYDKDKNEVDVITAKPNEAYDTVVDFLRKRYCKNGEWVKQQHNVLYVVKNGNTLYQIVIPKTTNWYGDEEDENQAKIVNQDGKFKYKSKNGTVHLVNIYDPSQCMCGTKGSVEVCDESEQVTCRNCMRLAGMEVPKKVEKKTQSQLEDGDLYYIICDKDGNPLKKKNKTLKHYIYDNAKKTMEGVRFLLKKMKASEITIKKMKPSNDGELVVLHHDNGRLYREHRLIRYYYYINNKKYAYQIAKKFTADLNIEITPKHYATSEIIDLDSILQ